VVRIGLACIHSCKRNSVRYPLNTARPNKGMKLTKRG
jgi:hypothetical protein